MKNYNKTHNKPTPLSSSPTNQVVHKAVNHSEEVKIRKPLQKKKYLQTVTNSYI